MYTGEMLNYTGSTLTWSFPTGGSNGLFVAGNATVHAQAGTVGNPANVTATIKLKGLH